ncbi:MAG TPA: hypothetical protein VGK67_32620 [Myxococcales bacterium]|jgi:hypothetical protein
MVPNYPDPPPFTLPDREDVTQEPPQVGYKAVPEHNDREWIGFENTGGGSIPASHTWTSNPKQLQDDLGSK